jgi:hypothetical protein
VPLDVEGAVAGIELAVQHQPRPRRVAADEPRLVEERRAHGAAVVSDDGIDPWLHPATMDRP